MPVIKNVGLSEKAVILGVVDLLLLQCEKEVQTYLFYALKKGLAFFLQNYH